MKDGVIHLISDATGETLFTLTRACLAQFDKSEFTEYRWPLVRSDEDLDKVIAAIATEPGIVFYTIVAPNLGERLREECRTMKVPCVPILDPLINTIANYVGTPAKNMPGVQYTLDSDYYERMEAINFVLAHDDGQSAWNLKEAEIVILGVSRTSKTPTSI
ncbi:MAG: kinase/pyrophosphorylase, partial [Magnetospiraceae bacterium]